MSNPPATAHRLWPLLRRLITHVSPRRKSQLVLLLVLTCVSSVAEFMSIGAVVPFVSVLTQPDRIFQVPFVPAIARAFGITSGAQMVTPLTVGFALAALLAGILRLVLLWISTNLANAIGTDLSVAIYERTLYQPYRVHVARPSSEIISSITLKVTTATGVITSGLQIFTGALLFGTILFTLIAIDPMVAVVAAVTFGSAYGLIGSFTRGRIRHNGNVIAHEQTQVIKTLQEGLGAIRDVLLDGTQAVYRGVYERSRVRLQRSTSENTFINEAPRYAMESLGVALIAGFVLLLSRRGGGIPAALPTLAAMALGAQRLLPLMQQIWGNWSVVAGSHAALGDVLELLEQPLPDDAATPAPPPLVVHTQIHCDQLSFRYTPDGPWVLQDIDVTITRGARVGFFGTTGAGKSTLVDLVMGLLEPTTGAIRVDGVAVSAANRRAWQRNVAHVPQDIFLTDGTIAENIAFGVPPEAIDHDRVQRAADQAQLTEFIDRSALRFQTKVGERGVRLSGGQRQRIGIARALYKEAGVLIFDEATSALDSETEQAVMQAIDGLSDHLTVIMIAHRLTTLRNCDLIVHLGHGRVKERMTYDQLVSARA